MKIFYLHLVTFFAFFLFSSQYSKAQYGENMYDPIEVGDLYWGNTFYDVRDNGGYGNDIGQSSGDIYYRFSLSSYGEVNISHCGSGFDTYMHVLDGYGNVIASNDDNGPHCSGLQSSMTLQLNAGVYYVVSEGYSYYSGYITTQINLSGLPPSPPGSNMNTAIDLGTISSNFSYSDTKNNSNVNGYGNDIGNASDDIYYKFQLTNSYDLDISHCQSNFDTYMYILDASGNVIYSRDDSGPLCAALQASLQVTLEPGVYYVVSEGYSSYSGDITTSISVTPEKTFAEESEHILEHLDMTPVTSGVLYDKAFPMAGIEEYQGLSTDPPTNSDHFILAYSEIYTSSLNQTGLLTPEALDTYLTNSYGTTNHSIGLLAYDYHYLDTNAIANNQIYVSNGQLYDVPNRTSSPYIAKRALIASPLFSVGTDVEVGQHTFSFDPTIVIKNTNAQVTSILVNFDDGSGPKTFFSGGNGNTVQANWSVPRLYTVTINGSLSDGTSFETKSEINVLESSSEPVTNCSGGTSFHVTGLPFDASAYGRGVESGGGTATIYYSDANCGTNKITKPIIFLDGFDPTNKRTATKIYKNFLNKKIKVGGQDVLLGDKLRKDGYDIVVYDFDDGGDLIEKNGLAVIALTDTLMQNYGVHLQDQFVIIGPSMGALIGQYALAYADHHNINTNTKLYISFDGPHQGANGAIGMQQMIDYFVQKGLISNIFFKDERNGLHRVASARQMLLHHSMADSEYPTADNFRSIFLNNLAAVENYPNPTKDPSKMRKVAIINGSSNLQTNPYLQPGGEMLYLQIPRRGLLGNINGRAGDRLRIEINAATNGDTHTTADMWLFKPWINIATGKWPRKRYYTSAAMGNSSYDSTIGSYFEDPVGRKEQTIVAVGLWVLDMVRKNSHGNTFRHNILPTFIPTTSAVDLQAGYATLSYNFKNEDLGCTGKSPFDRVYAPLTNQNHVAIDSATANWFENEIKGTPQPFEAQFTIEGPAAICGSGNYSIADLPTGASISYNITGYFTITSNDNHGNLTIQSGSIESDGVLTATINTGCGVYTITKTISAHPSSGTISSYISNIGAQKYLNATASVIPGTTGYTWFKWNGSSWDLIGPASSQPSFQYALPPCGGPYQYSCIIHTYCGVSTVNFTQYNTPCMMMMMSTNQTYSYSPNPANTDLSIDVIDDPSSSPVVEESTKKIKKNFEAYLLNDKGQKLRIGKCDKAFKLKFDVSEIPTGTYYLHILEGEELLKSQVLIEH